MSTSNPPEPAGGNDGAAPRRRHGLPVAGLLFLVPAAVILAMAVMLLAPLAQGLAARWGAPAVASDTPEHDIPVPAASPSPSAPAPASVIKTDSPRIPNAPSQGLFWIDAPDAELAPWLISQMSDADCLGQLFMFGWPKETATGPVMDWISRQGLGGVKVFGWNGAKLDTLASALGTMQEAALGTRLGIPLFTATDQEGGIVRHVKDTTSQTPGNMALGAAGLAGDAYDAARMIARELRALGINMNFAPTVDLYMNEGAHVIGSRAYGSDPALSGLLGSAAVAGMRAEGVIATAKHFPGHGNAVGDSHGMTPVLQEDLATLWRRDLVPYRMMAGDGLPAILVGHLAFPSIAGSLAPASINPKLNRDIIRDKLGFKGLVITDDMYMGGAADYGATQGWLMSDIVVEAIRAGNDVIEMSRTPALDDAIWTKSLARCASDPTFRAVVREAALRVIEAKLTFLKPTGRVPLKPDAQRIYEQVPAAGAAELFQQQAARAVTVIKAGTIPFGPPAGSRVAVIGQPGDFIRAAQAAWPRAELLQFANEPFYAADPAVTARAQALAARSDWVVFCLANPNSAAVLAGLKPWADRIVVLSTLTPIYLDRLGWVKTAVAVYGQTPDSYRFGIEAIRGRYAPGGALPIRTGR